jgi:hypothetical protein
MRVVFLLALFFALLALAAAGKHKAMAGEAGMDGEAVMTTKKAKKASKKGAMMADEAGRRLLGKKKGGAMAEADGEAIMVTSHKGSKKASKKGAMAGEAR